MPIVVVAAGSVTVAVTVIGEDVEKAASCVKVAAYTLGSFDSSTPPFKKVFSVKLLLAVSCAIPGSRTASMS
jgi:hypothetical protein